MEEKVASFELAKLLKGIGFKLNVNHSYVDLTPLKETFDKDNTVEYAHRQNHNSKKHRYSAPTLSLVQKWLREEHHIDVYVEPSTSSTRMLEWIGLFRDIKRTMNGVFLPYTSKMVILDSYDEALESALISAINHIISRNEKWKKDDLKPTLKPNPNERN